MTALDLPGSSSDENDFIDEKIFHQTTSAPVGENHEDGVNPIMSTIISPAGKEVLVNLTHGDDALRLATEAEELVVTDEEDRKLCWKIDLCMFPLMCLIYAVQFMDKIATGSAAVMGLQTDLKMKGKEYSWVGSAFYFGYLFMNLGPVQLIFQRSKRMASMLAGFIVIWGLILTCHAAPSVNYAAFIALRVLLGCAESVVTPCFTIITAQYWRSHEQFARISIWFGMNGLGTIILDSMAYGMVKHQHTYALKAWRLLFIIIGVITIFLGILIYLWIPDDPSKARFLNKREKLMVVHRIKSNQQGFGNHEIKWYQIKEALTDIRTWLYFAFTVSANIPNGGLSNFSSILFHTFFHYDVPTSLLMGIPGGAVEVVGCPLFGILAVWAANKKIPIWKYKLTWAIFAAILSLVAGCMVAFATQSKKAMLGGSYLFLISPVSFICVLSNISANTSGYTKKWTVSSINLVAYAAANLAGPQTFIPKQAPFYKGAKIAIVVCYAAMTVILIILLLVNLRENKRRDRIQAERGGPEKVENLEFADCTDFENPNFRYTL